MLKPRVIVSRLQASAAALVLWSCGPGNAIAMAPATSSGPAVAAGSIAQMLVGLAVVLALLGGIAWLLKRYSGLRGTGSGLIRIVGGAAVGQRERIVVVEVGGTWLLVGVAPGQVRTLHTMPRIESAGAGSPGKTGAAALAESGFATWLRRLSENRPHE